LIGYDRKWETEFPWLEVVTDVNGKAVGMLCKLCRKHKIENKCNHSKEWSETPCICTCKTSHTLYIATWQLQKTDHTTLPGGGVGWSARMSTPALPGTNQATPPRAATAFLHITTVVITPFPVHVWQGGASHPK